MSNDSDEGKVIAEYENANGEPVVISVENGLYTARVAGRVTQSLMTSDDLARYLSHCLHGTSYVAAKARAQGRVIYQIEAYCPTEPDNYTLTREDGGASLIFEPAFATVEDQKTETHIPSVERDQGMFVRVQSYDERVWPENGSDPNAHDEFAPLRGKRVRVTVEVLD